MPGERPPIDVVRDLFAAFDAGDADRFVAGLAEDVEFNPPGFWFGRREFRGRDEVRQSFLELMRMREAPDRQVDSRGMKYYLDGIDAEKVLVAVHIRIHELASGHSFGTEPAILHLVRDGVVWRTETYETLEEGLARLAMPVEAA
jgi:ketosteroid isomerase-like protein